MNVIPPINTEPPWCILPAMLTSSNAAEPGPGEVEWVSATTYAVGDVRIRVLTHRKYLRLTAGAGTTFPEVDPINWVDVGPTNRWAMFDTLRNTATQVASPLTVSITPGKRINAAAFMGLSADAVTVTLTVASVDVYTHTQSLILRRTTTWSEYFFGEFSRQPSLVLFDLPPFSGAVLGITLTGAGNVGLGALVIGTYVNVGQVEYNPEVDSLNFSKVTRDDFGNAALVPRRAVPKTNQTLLVDKTSVNKILALRDRLDAVPAVYSGLDDRDEDGYFEALLILGIWKRWSINLAYPNHAKSTLELEEI